MKRNNHVRRRLVAALALVLAAAGLTVTAAPAASAVPALRAEPRDDEGSTKSLTDKLRDTTKGYVEAKQKLDRSKKRQTALAKTVKQLDADLVIRQASMTEIARRSYQTGRIGPMAALLSASTPSSFLERATTLDQMASEEDRAVRGLRQTKTTQQQAKLAIDTEVRSQQKQLNVMAKRKKEAENALEVAQTTAAVSPTGGGSGFSGSSARSSGSARRNPDGSLPDESCSLDDPTTSGCITPRTLAAMNTAKSDGFTRFVSCFRPEGSGEHPLGRACDFAADTGGFGGVAVGASRNYGDRLADYFVTNADRLGVLYVIWFERIWLPFNGWQPYNNGNGDPSSDHTNHVHLSML